MAQTGKSESTLPDADLNPLLNPLLAANMGRWAEVYFTSPPERREQAVADLVRQLEIESGGKPSAYSNENEPTAVPRRTEAQVRETRADPDDATKAPNFSLTRSSPTQSASIRSLPTEPSTSEVSVGAATSVVGEHSPQNVLVCSECAHTNPERQRFCGMCGAPLLPVHENRYVDAAPFAAMTHSDRENVTQLNAPDSPHISEREHWADETSDELEKAEDLNLARESHDITDLRPDTREPDVTEPWISEEMAENDLPQFAREAEPVPYRYRLYIGVAVAVVLGALIYMAGRGDVFSGSQISPAAKSIPAQPVAPSAEPPAPEKPLPVEGEAAPKKPPQQAAPTAKNDEPTQVEQQPQLRAAARRTALPTSNLPAATQPNTSGTTGAEELAEAQSYLSASRGMSRDSREAAQLLWKAVAKGNASATLTLSDLYLRGDGVPKSCDQARLLLDAAARKGAKGAGERLRNLQAFGCR